MTLETTPGIIYCKGFMAPEIFTSEGFLRFDSKLINKVSIFTLSTVTNKLSPNCKVKFHGLEKEDFKHGLEYVSGNNKLKKERFIIDPRIQIIARPFSFREDNVEDYYLLEKFSNIVSNKMTVYSHGFSMYSNDDLVGHKEFFEDKDNDLFVTNVQDKEFWKMFFLFLLYFKGSATTKSKDGIQKIQISFKQKSILMKVKTIADCLGLDYVEWVSHIKERDGIEKPFYFIRVTIGQWFTKRIYFVKERAKHIIKLKFQNLTKKEMLAIYASLCQFTSRPFKDENRTRNIHYITVHSKRFANLIQYIINCFGFDCHYNKRLATNGKKIVTINYRGRKSFHILDQPIVEDAHMKVTTYHPDESNFFLVRLSPFSKSFYIWLQGVK